MSGTGRRRKPPSGEEGNEQYAPPEQPGYEQPGYEQSPQSPQYQTYAQPAEPQYDYDWRQPTEQPQVPPQAPAYEAPVYDPQPQSQPQYEQYDSYQSYQQPPVVDPSPGYGSGSGSGYSSDYGYQVPQQQPWEQPAAPAAAPTPPLVEPVISAQPAAPTRPRPRPEPRPEPQQQDPARSAAPAPAAPAAAPEPAPFEFEFDPFDDDEPGNAGASGTGEFAPSASAVSSASSASSTSAAPSAAVISARPPGDKDGYRADDFAFVDESDEPDVKGWLTFTESRADSRADRVRKMRVQLIALGVVVALVGAGVGVYAWLSGGSGSSAQAVATKSMILFQLDDSKGDSIGDALMVTQRGGSTNGSTSGTGAIVVIPSQMQIDDQGFGSQPFGGDMASDEPPAGSDAVSGALGVTPDGVWTMDETTFGIFVDEIGGITLTTNAAVPASTADPKGVSAGTEKLSGAQAVAYATYEASGEAASAQAVRFGQVMNALMAVMPTFANSVQADLNQLGLIPDPALPISKLSPILAALAAQDSGGKVTVATLPLSSDQTLNATAAAEIVTKLLGGTAAAGASAGQAARVLVQNGTGASSSTSGQLMAVAQAKLDDAGYTYNGGNVVSTQAHTEVEVGSSANQSLAEQVAASLGLSGSAVQVVSGLPSVDDVTVVLGQDWSSLSAD